MELVAPIKGKNTSAPLDKMPPLTTQDMNNMRPIDIFEKKLRLSQRPGQDKLFAQQIGGSATPVVFTGFVTTID